MSIRGGFDRLTKEIDALTYNSRSVLNALIRSTVASGSSQGYTVTRVGIELTLSRVDIYRLYTFYQEWESNGFNTEQNTTSSLTFDTIRLQQDEIPVVDDNGTSIYGAATAALVTHSKILFLNSTTLALSTSTVVNGQIVDNTASTAYWLDKLEYFNNPKLLTNSAPIPINLRTPVFDENMATTAYNNHPTYLFPYQYFGLQALGYLGDGTDHYGGGKSWEWEVDEYVTYKTPAFASGDVNSESVYKTSAQRNFRINPATGITFEPTYSTVWGYDTHARSLYSTAGGRSSMVPRGATNSTAIGLRNLASDIQTTSIGGTTNKAVAQNSGVYAGKNNITAGNVSFATGSGNITGGDTFDFTLPLSNTDDACVPDTSECAEIIAGTDSQFGFNSIAVSGNVIASTSSSLNGFSVDDTVIVYAYTTFVAGTDESKNEYFTTNGDTFISVTSKIIGMGYFESGLNTGKTVITLKDDLPNPARIDGGTVTKKNVRLDNSTGIGAVNLGESSSVFGSNNIASGVNQTVVGQYNRPVLVDGTSTSVRRMSRFVVGGGSSESNRLNTLEVYDGRMVVYTVGQTVDDIPVIDTDYPTSTFKGVDISSDSIRLIYNTTRIESNNDGFILEHNTGGQGSVSVSTGKEDQLIIENRIRHIKIQTGQNTQRVPVDTNSIIGDSDIGLISRGDIYLSAIDDIRVGWNNKLKLEGDTLGALPTTDKQYSHLMTPSVIDLTTLSSSGFYFINPTGSVSDAPSDIGLGADSGFHLLTMGADPDANGVTSFMQFAWAGPTTAPDLGSAAPNGPVYSIDNIGRPAIRATGDHLPGGINTWLNLAYIDDIGNWVNILNNIFDIKVKFGPNNPSTGESILSEVLSGPSTSAYIKVTSDTMFIKLVMDTSQVDPSVFAGGAYSIWFSFNGDSQLRIPLFSPTNSSSERFLDNANPINYNKIYTHFNSSGTTDQDGTVSARILTTPDIEGANTIEISQTDYNGNLAEIDKNGDGDGSSVDFPDIVSFNIIAML